jgi:hypothetical protein
MDRSVGSAEERRAKEERTKHYDTSPYVNKIEKY